MFDNTRPDPEALARVKALFVATFELKDDTLVSVSELRCHEPDCPPVETVVTARETDGTVRDWRVHKPMAEIDEADVLQLKDRPA
ncbi:hypothetical protein SLH47_25540 [Cognatiyoonia sp. IB215182]|nr:hypothetical protein [Cognatiyoonia sp. IB215182]